MQELKKVKIKKLHKDAVIPKYSNAGDAGMDMTAVSKEMDGNGNVVYMTGLAMEIPDGYVGLIFPRSSISKKSIALTNSVGVIDSGYRGEIMFKFKPMAYYTDNIEDGGLEDFDYEIGDRIGQIMILPYPQILFETVDELTDHARGKAGFGSTGK